MTSLINTTKNTYIPYRLQILETGRKELQDAIELLKNEKEGLEQRLDESENQMKSNGELYEKLKDKVASCGMLSQVNAQLKIDNAVNYWSLKNDVVQIWTTWPPPLLSCFTF